MVRTLAAARAVVFASLVPDPDHPECPADFRAAVEDRLKANVPDVLKSYRRGRTTHLDPDPYRPYDGQPDTLRNRLLMFIAKWSPEWLAFEAGKSKKEPGTVNLLDDRSLVKWETSGPTIRVGSKDVANPAGQTVVGIARDLVRIANGGEVPTVLDPFSGGGAIPVEAGRVGAQPIANDYNPVAYLILRATCEFPQRYGKPGMRKTEGALTEVEVPNVLVHDVERYAREILRRTERKVGHLYPAGSVGRPVIGYLWARTVPCSNPSCKAEIPLLRSLFVCNRSHKKIALTMSVKGKETRFGITEGEGIQESEGTMLFRGDCRCPICGQVTGVESIRQAGIAGHLGERMVAVIIDSGIGKGYRPVEAVDREACDAARRMADSVERPAEFIRPEVTTSETRVANRGDITIHLYWFKTWGSMCNPRQLFWIQTMIGALRELVREIQASGQEPGYCQALAAYLGLWLSRTLARMTSFGRWDPGEEKFQTPFDMAKIAMMWDYAEANPFNAFTGGALGQLDWVSRFLARESRTIDRPAKVGQGDSASLPYPAASMDCVVTDPPYFDAIAYADLSDMSYVWLKRAIGDVFDDAFRTPMTPKADEATALTHRHGGDADKAENHFTRKLAECFAEARRLTKPGGVMSVMFAHQTTKPWTALVNSLFKAGLNITATFPMDTELKNRARGLDSSALESSITVVCRPRAASGLASFKDVRRNVERVVKESVHRSWGYGFRGADLIVACYGPAVGEFGKHERVERGDGTPVTVPELLQLVREAALKAIAGEFSGDALSRLYFVWANLYGVSPQSFDDMRLVVQVGGEAEEVMDIARGRGLFVVDGANARLALLADRAGRRQLGDERTDPLIDQLHRAMLLWKKEDRAGLVEYLHGHELADHAGFWRLAQALFEVLPRDGEDRRLISAILGERNTLRTEIKRREAALTGIEPSLFE